MSADHWNIVNATIMPDQNLDQLIDDLTVERDRYVSEKRNLEGRLCEIQNWKRAELSKILSKGLRTTQAISATADLEVEVIKQKTPLLNRMEAVEKRLRELKTEASRLVHAKENSLKPEEKESNKEVLLRIEQLLIKLITKIEA